MRARIFGLSAILASSAAATFVLGCAHASHDQLSTRASFDLQCPASQITVYELDRRTRGVRGCGQQVTYIESCDGPRQNLGTDCTWVLNADSSTAGR